MKTKKGYDEPLTAVEALLAGAQEELAKRTGMCVGFSAHIMGCTNIDTSVNTKVGETYIAAKK